VRNIRY